MHTAKVAATGAARPAHTLRWSLVDALITVRRMVARPRLRWAAPYVYVLPAFALVVFGPAMQALLHRTVPSEET